jgi:hypothetical protein
LPPVSFPLTAPVSAAQPVKNAINVIPAAILTNALQKRARS